MILKFIFTRLLSCKNLYKKQAKIHMGLRKVCSLPLCGMVVRQGLDMFQINSFDAGSEKYLNPKTKGGGRDKTTHRKENA